MDVPIWGDEAEFEEQRSGILQDVFTHHQAAPAVEVETKKRKKKAPKAAPESARATPEVPSAAVEKQERSPQKKPKKQKPTPSTPVSTRKTIEDEVIRTPLSRTVSFTEDMEELSLKPHQVEPARGGKKSALERLQGARFRMLNEKVFFVTSGNIPQVVYQFWKRCLQAVLSKSFIVPSLS